VVARQSLSGTEVRTCLLPLLQADSQSGGAAPTVSIVCRPDSTVRESRDRVRAAIRHAGLEFPVALITVSLTPTC
jgi:magnesium chelatase family protein